MRQGLAGADDNRREVQYIIKGYAERGRQRIRCYFVPQLHGSGNEPLAVGFQEAAETCAGANLANGLVQLKEFGIAMTQVYTAYPFGNTHKESGE